jgi:GrpB-like predicted nucleotidyltransferase (UPF0157 family)
MLFTKSNHHWLEQFSQERLRLLSALRHLTEGGIIEDIQHIGATSVPGLPARACLDIAISICPFPLESEYRAKLESLGYELLSDSTGMAEQRFRHTTGMSQLFILEAGGGVWTDYLLMRDYWQHNEDARHTYAARKQEWSTTSGILSAEYEASKAEFFLHALEAARPWHVNHQGFIPVETVANELSDFRQGWHISAGWALDLFLGRVTRVHHDVDVLISRVDQLPLQAYLTARDWKLMTPWQGRLEPWPTQMYLERPRHQIHAFRDGQFIDFHLGEIEPAMWRYRRAENISRSIERISLHSKTGIPFLAPEVVLLFKSKNTSGRERPKDQADFERIYPHLEPERRAWLIWALLETAPLHSWTQQLIEGDWWRGK